MPERIRREQFFPAMKDKFLPQLYAAFGKPGSETVQTVTVYVAFVHVVAQKAHVPVSHVNQIFARDLPARVVIHADMVGSGNTHVAVRKNGGDIGQGFQRVQVSVVRAAEDHARHVPSPQIRIDLLVVVGKADQGIVAVLLKLQR